MRVKRVLRYYCEFCKKSGGLKPAMETHEAHCTLNPNRACRMCGSGPWQVVDAKPFILATSDVEFAKIVVTSFDLDGLEAKTDHCPACTLAALRVSGIFVPYTGFNFKKACKEHWDMHNNEQRALIGYVG